jgi:hypothetical protein
MIARLLLLVLVVGFLAAVPLRGQDKDHYRVRLIVGSPANSIIGVTTSYLTQELRRVGDIDVIEEDPHFIIDVVATPDSDRTYMFSVVVIGTSPPFKYTHFVIGLHGTTDDLDVLCRKVAAHIHGILLRGL